MDSDLIKHLTKIEAEQGKLAAEQAKQGTELSRLAIEQAKFGVELSRMANDFAEMKDLLKAMYPLLLASNARSEEQSKRIDDLSRLTTSLVPQRLAAVGGQ